MMYFLLLIFSFVSAEVTLSVPGLSPRNDPPVRSTPLTADNYLDPLTDLNRNRPATWPQQLTFTDPLNLTARDVMNRLRGEWRRQYHCQGKPVEAAYLANLGLFDGYINESSSFEIRNNQWIRKVFPPGRRNQVAPQVNNTCTLTITRNNASTSQFDMQSTNCTGDSLLTVVGSIRRVNETGEEVLEFFNNLYRCPNGELLKVLLVPYRQSPIISSIRN